VHVSGGAASPALAQLTANLRLLVEAAPPAKEALAAVHAAAADAAAAAAGAAGAGHDENDASSAFAFSAAGAGGRSGGSVPLSAGKARVGVPHPGHHHSHEPASPTPATSAPSPPPAGVQAVAGPHDAIVRKEMVRAGYGTRTPEAALYCIGWLGCVRVGVGGCARWRA
jgi:hypothetical protein